MEFKEWFCLKDRDSFTIDPKINPTDAQFYFGRTDVEKRITAQLRKSFIAPGTPKIMVWGPYGSGKTQTLYYVHWYLDNNKPHSCKLIPRVLHVDIEVASNSTCGDIHIQLVEAVGRDAVLQWVQALFKQVSDINKELLDITSDKNIANALAELRAGGDSSMNAWRWLQGDSGLKPRELEALHVTRRLGQIGAGDMVNVLISIGELAERNGEKLIFMIDEMEELMNVRSGDSAESIHQYMRKVAEPANSSAGFIIGFKADTLNDAPAILIRDDVRSRIGEINYLEIPHLPAVQDVKTFVQEMLRHLVDQGAADKKIQTEDLGITLDTYPFSAEAFELLCDYASQDPVKSLPRNLINCINECAIQAWDQQSQIVDENIVNDVAPLVFG